MSAIETAFDNQLIYNLLGFWINMRHNQSVDGWPPMPNIIKEWKVMGPTK